MENKINDLIFQVDSKEVLSHYKRSPNYLIDSSKIENENEKYCAIYFSSHDIYFPNTAEAFNNQLVKKDRYEWFGSRIKKASKHIFLRDIKKQWYLSGINDEINSIDRILNFLITETKGYKVITVGSSAGGFAAMLFGQQLNANKIFTFNGQTQLYDLLESSTENKNPLVFRLANDPNYNKFYSIKNYLKKPESIYYFYSNKSEWDLIQYNHVKKINMNYFSFNTNHHGIPFLKSSTSQVINLNEVELKKISKKKYHPIVFSAKIEGWSKALKSLCKQVINKYKKVKK